MYNIFETVVFYQVKWLWSAVLWNWYVYIIPWPWYFAIYANNTGLDLISASMQSDLNKYPLLLTMVVIAHHRCHFLS